MNQVPRILIVDDEPSIRQMLKTHLMAQNFIVDEAGDGKSALQKISEFHPHLLILDLGLPDMDGKEVLLKLRQWTPIPVIVLTVNDDDAMKVELLDAGADDYLSKPFSLPELLARIRVALRNHQRQHQLQEATPEFKSGNLEIDLNSHQIKVEGQIVKLTTTEFELLARLVRGRGKVVSQSQLLREIWGPHSEEHIHYLRIYIGQLRKKIEKDHAHPVHILTEPGVGYRIV